MEVKKILFCRFILFLMCVEPKSTIQSRAVVVYPDQRVQINCKLNSNREFSQWIFAPVGSSSTPTVLVSGEAGLGPSFKGRYDFNSSDPDALTIRRANQQDAGRYTCKKLRRETTESNISEFSTEIIFLYGNMSCDPTDLSRVIEGEILTLQCNISYKGNPRAVMEWRQNDNRPIDSQPKTQYTAAAAAAEKDPNSTTATSSLQLTVGSSTSKLNYTCTTRFNTSSISASPTLHWTFPQILVLYKPRDIKISPVDEVDFYVGDSLTCSADASPEPDFKWKLDSHKNNYSGNTFTIEAFSANDEAIMLTCTAKNSLGSIDSTKRITIRSRYLLPKSTAATIGVSCVLLVLLAVLAVYVIHLKKNGTGGGQDNKTTEQRTDGSQNHHSESHSSNNTPEPSEDLIQEQEQERVEEEENGETETGDYAKLGARENPAPSVYMRLNKQIPQKLTFDKSAREEETSHVYANAESAVCYYNVI